MTHQVQCAAVQIPVPWGHVAGKWWGAQDKRPILCLHGWQESCGTFDPLLQLLAAGNVGFLAIDWPGHGYSSPLPDGMFYHAVNAPLLVRRLQRYFGWRHVSLLTHSISGGLGLYFACLYPADVDLLVQIDGMKPFSRRPGADVAAMGALFDQFLEHDDRRRAGAPAPRYTYAQVQDKLVRLQGTVLQGSILPHTAHWVLERTIRPVPEEPTHFHIRRDIRLRVEAFLYMQHGDLCESVKRVRCPVLSMKCTESSWFECPQYIDDVLDVLRTHNRHFELVRLEGTHHVHINEPDKVAALVHQFLAKYNHGDRSDGRLSPEILGPCGRDLNQSKL